MVTLTWSALLKISWPDGDNASWQLRGMSPRALLKRAGEVLSAWVPNRRLGQFWKMSPRVQFRLTPSLSRLSVRY